MNEYKLACAINNIYGKEVSIERALEGVCKIGFKYITFSFTGPVESSPGTETKEEDLNDKTINLLGKKVKRYGLIPLAILAACDIEKEEAVAILKRRIDVAKLLGVETVDTIPPWPYKSWPDNIKKDEELKRDEENFYKNILEIADHAKKQNVIVGIETHAGITGTGKLAIDVIKKINSENIKVTYDPCNIIFYMGEDPVNDIGYIASYVCHVHIKDKSTRESKKADFVTPGKGIVDFKSVFQILNKFNFNGNCSIEMVPGDTVEEREENLKEVYEFFTKLFNRVKGG